jgi:hypothetical protein
MKIKTNSWHYRLLMSFHHHENFMPRDFCSYWRQLVLMVLFLALAGFGIVFVASYLLVFPFYELGVIGGLIWHAVTVAIVGGVVWLVKRPQKDRQPTLIGTRYQAWKGRYCPTVEFIDE